VPLRYRAWVELALLLGLCASIIVMGGYGQIRAVLQAGLWPAMAAAIAATAFVGLWQLVANWLNDVSLLTGALWDLIRTMEVRGRAASSARATDRKDLLHHFAVDGAAKVGAGRAMPMGDVAALDLTKLAFELMDRNDKDGSGHGNRVNSLRRGIFVFYAIMKLRDPEVAFRSMCEHMKVQLRLGEDSGIENFTELKRLLGLPAVWPTNLDIITGAEERGLSFSRYVAIREALKATDRIFAGVRYKPLGQADEISDPERILTEMREYIR
jgi:hypothetical protein